MALVYHNITPPEYFLGVHDMLVRQCYHGRRELLAYRDRVDLALGDSEFNRQELEALGFSPTACCRSCRTSRISTPRPIRASLDAFDDAWTNMLFVGRVVPNKRPDDVIRYFAAYKRLFNPRARLHSRGLVRRLRRLRRAAVRSHRAVSAWTTCISLGQVTNEELTALYDVADLVFVRERARRLLRAADRGFYKRVPVMAFAATAVPATMDGGGVLYDTRDPRRVAALMQGVLRDGDARSAILKRRTPRSGGCARRISPAR